MLFLRPVCPEDLELLLRWENDPAVWAVSGTRRAFTAEQMAQFILDQQAGFEANGAMRLMIEVDERPVGAIDLFHFDPSARTAGVGILIYEAADRRRGHALRALAILQAWATETLGLARLWCCIQPDNAASLALFRRAGFTPRPRFQPPGGSAPSAVFVWEGPTCAAARPCE